MHYVSKSDACKNCITPTDKKEIRTLKKVKLVLSTFQDNNYKHKASRNKRVEGNHKILPQSFERTLGLHMNRLIESAVHRISGQYSKAIL